MHTRIRASGTAQMQNDLLDIYGVREAIDTIFTMTGLKPGRFHISCDTGGAA